MISLPNERMGVLAWKFLKSPKRFLDFYRVEVINIWGKGTPAEEMSPLEAQV